MNIHARAILAFAALCVGLAANEAVERATARERPALRRPLATIPTRLGRWAGRDVPVDPRVARESQATEYLNRSYEHADRPGAVAHLWINYSEYGLNMRHSPEVCLPSGGWELLESAGRVVEAGGGASGPVTISLLGYAKDDLVQHIGFWYYIFGEGRVERFVRSLPITSRSSHGRSTRGSGLTVEVFYSGDGTMSPRDLDDFLARLLDALEPVLPADRESYHIP